MADVYTRIGYIKGATGAPGAQGAKGDTGDAATIQVGSVTTVPYGQTANVVNSGTEQAAVFDFTIPQGRPGQQTTEMDNLLLNSITTSAAEFPVPAVGETGKVIFGKITKWFSDMAALVASKFDAANVVNNLTTTASGYALDARQGKAIGDLLTTHSERTYTNSTYLSGNITVGREGMTAYIMYSASVYIMPTSGDWTVLVSGIPAEYRPRRNVVFASTDVSTSHTIAILVSSTGTISYYTPTNIPGGTSFRIYALWGVPADNII